MSADCIFLFFWIQNMYVVHVHVSKTRDKGMSRVNSMLNFGYQKSNISEWKWWHTELIYSPDLLVMLIYW